MRLSHSKLNEIILNPAEYYLSHKQEISLKEKPAALSIGSAVHYGIENSNYDLEEYYKNEGSFHQRNNYTKEQLLAESMVYGYLNHKDEIFEKILTDPVTNEKLQLIDETHEVLITSKLKTYLNDHEDHEFLGIIDLLLLTNKGFIIIDYKTSSQTPDWDNYIEQLYRYIYLIKNEFPNIPIVKIGIVNIRKSMIRQKKNENDEEFFNRLKFEYELNDENYINYHEYFMEDINPDLMNKYIINLSHTADLAQLIEDNELYFINYTNAKTVYGKSQYWNIFYEIPDSHYLYEIKDHIWDEEKNDFVEKRDCVEIDMKTLTNKYVLNKYSLYKKERDAVESNALKNGVNVNIDLFNDDLKDIYLTDDNLLNVYNITYMKEKKKEEINEGKLLSIN